MSRHVMPIDNPADHAGYVLYNLVYSGDHDRFTANEMSEALLGYGIEMSPSEVRWELSSYVKTGMLHSYIDHYAVPMSKREHREWWLREACPA